MESPQVVTQYSAKTVDLEPDAIAVCDSYLDYFVIGTYSLIEDGSSDSVKRGSIETHHFDSTLQAGTSGIDESIVGRENFPFGIYDIHFHPEWKTLLGVATSNAEILFYQFTATTSRSATTQPIKLIPLGKINAELPQDSNLAIITQFQFLNTGELKAENTSHDHDRNVFLTATTQFGNTKVIQVSMHSISENATDIKGYENLPTLESVSVDVHKQSMDLEAWTVCPINVSNGKILFVSGGDDSQMKGSVCEISINEPYFRSPPIQIFVEKRSHEAGVVSLLSIGRDKLDEADSSFLLLSGSYDEHLRLFALDSNTLKPVLKSVLKLPGGVWRIYLLDEYMTSTGPDYILLIAAHLGGAFIIRLSQRKEPGTTTAVWTFVVEAEFTTGHKSLVYACTAICSEKREQKRNWSVVSTSFYDKQVCTWEWIDGTTQSRA